MTVITKPSAWTDEITAFAKDRYEAGLSAQGVTDALNRTFGADFTRNAIIGKLVRIGVLGGKNPRRVAAAQKPIQPKPAQQPKPRFGHLPPLPKGEPVPPPPPFIPRVVDTSPLNLSLLDLTDDTCKFECSGQDNPALYVFCGHATFGGTPYCARHAKLAYQPQPVRRRADLRAVA